MYLEITKVKGAPYLRVAEAYRYTKDGVSIQRRKIIRHVGPLAKFDDGQPNYLERLRESFKEGSPIIESLSDLIAERGTGTKVKIGFDSVADCYCEPRNIGYFFFDALYDALGIGQVLANHKSRSVIDYDVNGNAKLLSIGRALKPDSKLATFENRACYMWNVTSSERLREIYDALDVLNDKADAIQKRINLRVSQSIGRDTEVCFYDVTNYYFEISENDPDIVGKDGKVQNGLRKKGVSKEKRGEPIVQMGLFIDDHGIPIGYKLFPGNNTDQTTLRPALNKIVHEMNFGRVIIIADGGLNSSKNICCILDAQNGYIVAKSTKKSTKEVKKWILDENDYAWNSSKTFKVKSQVRVRKVKDEYGQSQTIAEKIVCFWSKAHFDRECHENEQFIKYLNSVVEHPDKLKDKEKKIAKFLKKQTIDKDTGEPVSTQEVLKLDMAKVQDYIDLMGYYTLMTSEIEKSDTEIIAKYHGLSRIEDSFRITKSNLEGRPVYVRTPEHINAHFLTCFIALTMIRLIQYKILKFQGKDTKNEDGWESGLSAERIQNALKTWCADPLPQGYYRLTRPTDDLQLILSACGVTIEEKLYPEPDVRKIKHSIAKTC